MVNFKSFKESFLEGKERTNIVFLNSGSIEDFKQLVKDNLNLRFNYIDNLKRFLIERFFRREFKGESFSQENNFLDENLAIYTIYSLIQKESGIKKTERILFAENIFEAILYIKRNNLTKSFKTEVLARSKNYNKLLNRFNFNLFSKEDFLRIWEKYEDLKRERDLVDLGDILVSLNYEFLLDLDEKRVYNREKLESLIFLVRSEIGFLEWNFLLKEVNLNKFILVDVTNYSDEELKNILINLERLLKRKFLYDCKIQVTDKIVWNKIKEFQFSKNLKEIIAFLDIDFNGKKKGISNELYSQGLEIIDKKQKGKIKLTELSNPNEYYKFNIEYLLSKIIDAITERNSSKSLVDKEKSLKVKSNLEINYLFLPRSKDFFKFMELAEFLDLELTSIRNIEPIIFQKKIIGYLISILKIVADKNDSSSAWFNLFQFYHLDYKTIRDIFKRSKMLNKSIYRLLTTRFMLIEKEFEKEKEILIQIGKNLNFLIQEFYSGGTLKELLIRVLQKFKFYNNILMLNRETDILAINIFRETLELFEDKIGSDLDEFLLFFEYEKNRFDKEISLEYEYLNEKIVVYSNSKLFDLNITQSNIYILNNSYNIPIVEYYNKPIYNRYDYYIYKEKIERDLLKFSRVNNLSIFSQNISFFKFLNKSSSEMKIITRTSTSLLKSNSLILNNLLSIENKNRSENNFRNNSFMNVLFNEYDLNYSVSKLKSFKTCPRKYLFSYIYAVPEEPKPFFAFGTLIHKVLENILDLIGTIPDEAVFANAVSLLRQDWYSKSFSSVEEERDYFDKGLKMISNFIQKEKLIRSNSKRETILKEKRFSITLSNKKIVGIIDRIDILNAVQQVEIIDYKTSKNSISEYKLKSDIQLFIYGLAYHKLYQKFPDYVSLWFLSEDKIVKTKFSEINSTELIKDILNTINQIEKREFFPKKSALCNYCDYKEICDLIDSSELDYSQ